MYISIVISTSFDKAKRRITKVLRLGKSDTQTAIECAPYGIDGNPVKDLRAIYADTGVKGREVILGYINIKQLADVGELRLYSTDAEGNLKFYTWLKKDGTYEIGGSADNMVRFSKLKETIDELQNDITTLKQKFQTWIPVPNDGGAALKTVTAPWFGTPLTKPIDPAKIDQVKTL